MEQLTYLEVSFTTKMDAKFQEVVAWLPPTPKDGAPSAQAPIGWAHRVAFQQGQTLIAGAAGATVRNAQPDAYYGADESKDEHEDEGEVLQKPPGCLRPYILIRITPMILWVLSRSFTASQTR
jgi:hypothetical protein